MVNCNVNASGNRVALGFIEEEICDVTPAGFGAFILPDIDKTGSNPGETIVTYTPAVVGVLPGQIVEISISASAVNNGFWRVKSVTSTIEFILYDELDVMVDDSGGALSMRSALETLRATGRQFDRNVDTLESEEVRLDRQYSDVRQGFITVDGSPGYELSLESYDQIIKGVMSSEWYTVPYTGGIPSFLAATPTAGYARLDRTSGNWETDGYRIGDTIETTGFAAPGNNAQWIITNIVGQDVTVADPEEVVTSQAGTGVTFPGERIDIGQILRTYTFEQAFTDIQQYRLFTGCTPNEMSWNVSPDSIVNGTFTFLGMDSGDMTGSSIGGTYRPAPITPVFAALNGQVIEGGVVAQVITSLDFTINNQRTTEAVVGSRTSPGIFDGRAKVEGNIVTMLAGDTIYNKFQNETDSDLTFRLQDPNDSNNFMRVTFNRVKYITGTIDPPSEGFVPLAMGFQALVSEQAMPGGLTTTTTLSIQKSNATGT